MFTRSLAFALSVAAFTLYVQAAGPTLLDDQFELPPGFHIYRAATRELTGGSYAMAFDGDGRLLIGDGTALRRLVDSDGDGVYDKDEVVATNLGWRGPQGVLVYGDRLYAVGGDGVQLYSGYRGARLQHRGRIGNKFLTGGDHDAHTLLRGFDGKIYLMAGNGAGIKGCDHITETNSPMLVEREASIFRFDPDGSHWECVAGGGRNPPNLGQNYLGDFFGFDSDMEWHVGLPWYRPVRLNHWIIGADQGWQEVGAYPPYYIDCVPGILDVGRGSPTWGTFYEHTQFPSRYRNNYFACDYRWKAANNDQYASSGRLVCFALERSGASWKANMEVLARPRPGAKETSGQPINFALVDVKVAPDGSLVVSDHNQGIWRIFYSLELKLSIPKQVSRLQATNSVDELLRFPQPDAEWSRVVEAESIRQIPNASDGLQQAALEQNRPIPERLRALRLLTSHTEQLGFDWLRTVSADPEPEIRAWVPLAMSFRSQAQDFGLLRLLANDTDPLVRRRVAECFTRRATPAAVPALIQLLGDTERVTRYPAMTALEHLPTDLWLNLAIASTNTQAALRGLVAGTTAGAVPANAVLQVVRKTREKTPGREDQLDLLRVIAIFKTDISKSVELESTKQYLLNQLRSNDHDVSWESIRLCGVHEIGESVAPLISLLAGEVNHTTQFHIMQSLARISDGWDASSETTVLDWLIANQQGWFAEFESKGVEFPLFWETTLGEFAGKHSPALIRNRSRIHLEGLLGTALIHVIAHGDEPLIGLQKVYRSTRDFTVKTKAVAAMHDLKDLRAGEFARQEFTTIADPPLRREFVQIVAAHPTPADVVLLGTALGSGDRDTLKAAIHGLTQLNGRLPQEILAQLIQLLAARREMFWPVHTLLRTQGSIQSSADTLSPDRAPDQTVQQATARSWKNWYAATFNTSFPEQTTGNTEKSDEEVHGFIVASAKTPGDRTSGRKVYERLLCNSCHGGGETPGQEGKLFGPDLAGVMQRLNPTELADAIVYPSKQVADRFKAATIELDDGELITGFVTARDNESVTIADQQQVHRISVAHIRRLTSETGSLMPEHLLNDLTSGEIRDLLAFLNRDVSPK